MEALSDVYLGITLFLSPGQNHFEPLSSGVRATAPLPLPSDDLLSNLAPPRLGMTVDCLGLLSR